MTSISALKSMENGSIGEARTKELLIDRFWILERSVDIQGADFIIQRKLLERNLLDNSNFSPSDFRSTPEGNVINLAFFISSIQFIEDIIFNIYP